jgi:hypothetical protein
LGADGHRGYRIRFEARARGWLDRIEYGRAVQRGWTAVVGVLGLGVVLASALLVPLQATATDSDLKHAYAFRLEASNGYSILALASSQRADGRGEIVLFVGGKASGATYVAPARLTATRIDADLGGLGVVALDVVPSGHTRTVRMGCGEGLEKLTYEPQSFRGIFEFHGEEGYADATSTAPAEYTRFFFALFCGGSLFGESGGQGLPGARLRLHSRRGSSRLDLQANKNRPRARTRLEVETHEKHRGIAISRSRTLWVGSNAFAYDPLLRTATLDPPAPFSGHATFHRGAPSAGRWTGTLTVDLPGKSNVPLAGAGIGATLVPACFHEGEGRFRC